MFWDMRVNMFVHGVIGYPQNEPTASIEHTVRDSVRARKEHLLAPVRSSRGTQVVCELAVLASFELRVVRPKASEDRGNDSYAVVSHRQQTPANRR